MNDKTNIDDKAILDLLRPRYEVKASDALRKRTDRSLNHAKRLKSYRMVYTAIASAAAIAAIFIIVVMHTPHLSAQELIKEALTQLGVEYSIEFEGRTTPDENFAFFDETLSSIPVRLDVHGNEWKITKGDRTAYGNGSTKYMWIPSRNVGWKSASSAVNFIEDFRYLLDPHKLLSDELANTNANTNIEVADDKITLTVTDNSDDTRIYVFNKTNHRLLGYSVERHGKEIVKSTAIRYRPVVVDRDIPNNLAFIDIDNIRGSFANLSAEEVATIALAAFKSWDASIIEKAFAYYNLELIRAKFEGADIVRIGTPTRRNYHSIVPYCIRLHDGKVIYGNLSLAPMDDGGWIIDGGI